LQRRAKPTRFFPYRAKQNKLRCIQKRFCYNTAHMKKTLHITILISTVFLLSCSHVHEVVKKIWGSSTMTLEKERSNAFSSQFECTFEQCYEFVLSYARNEESEIDPENRFFDVFIKDPVKAHIIVLGLEGNVDTTEVGIFFYPVESGIGVDVTSLSTSAKRKVSEFIFRKLEEQFRKIG